MIIAPIAAVRRATPSTRIVRLRVDFTLFRYRAGQAAEIGPASAQTLIPYSIASAPGDTVRDGYVEFLIKVAGEGSWGERFGSLRRGDRVRVKGPLGRFTFPDHPLERHFLFIAGGTGIAPLRSMIRQVRGAVPGVFRLLYSARTPADFAYLRELRGMARRREIELKLTATGEPPGHWRHARGRITAAQLATMIDHPETLCFVCGPAAMVDEVPRALGELGVDKARIKVEEW